MRKIMAIFIISLLVCPSFYHVAGRNGVKKEVEIRIYAPNKITIIKKNLPIDKARELSYAINKTKIEVLLKILKEENLTGEYSLNELRAFINGNHMKKTHPQIFSKKLSGEWIYNAMCHPFKISGDMMDIFPYNAGLWALFVILDKLFPSFPLLSGIPLLLIMILGTIPKTTTLGLWIVDQYRGDPYLYANGIFGETEIEKKEGNLIVVTLGFTGVVTIAWRPSAIGSALFVAAK